MKKLLIGLALLTAPMIATAQCSTHTYYVDGRYVMCTTCCYNGNCNTTCL